MVTHIARISLIATIAAAAAVSTNSFAAAPDALAAGAGCSVCHAPDKKIMGPAYHDIAGKYRGDSKAAAKLAAKVRSGGSGAWGAIPMPAVDAKKISDADLAAVIAWILKQ